MGFRKFKPRRGGARRFTPTRELAAQERRRREKDEEEGTTATTSGEEEGLLWRVLGVMKITVTLSDTEGEEGDHVQLSKRTE